MQGNILISSASGKVLLVEAFRKAAKGRHRIFAGDINKEISARFAADDFLLLERSSNPAFCDHLLALCLSNDIRLIIPTRDAELAPLARRRDDFLRHGITVHVAGPEAIAITQDKLRFTQFCVSEGLPILPHLDFEEAMASLPVFVRKRVGAGGVGATAIRDRTGLNDIRHEYEMFVVNRAIIDRGNGNATREYTVDLLRSLDGATTIGAAVRERLAIESGESQQGVVVNEPELENVAIDLGNRLGLIGHNTIQLFKDPQRGPLLIEVNPRFGGAANLGIRAGLDSPARILSMLSTDAAEREAALRKPDIHFGLRMYRHKRDFIVDENGNVLSCP